MSQETILAIDHGTQSVRALLFDLEGNQLAKAQLQIQPYFSTQPGWAEQNPEFFWESLCQVCRKLWETTGLNRESIRGVALTTQRGTVINLDAQGQPLRPAIVWPDMRLAQGIKPVGGAWGLIFKGAGLSNLIGQLQQEAEANWIKINQPEIWQKTAHYLLLSGYLSYRLTGQTVDSIGCQVGYLPFDSKKQRWSSRLDWKWQAIELKRETLPQLQPPATILGHITPEAAAATGIPARLPLVAAASDKACEVIGMGGLEPHTGCISYGTSATFNVMHRRYLEVVPQLPPFPAGLPGAYNLETMVKRGYGMVSWFKNEFAHHEQQIALERGIDAEELFDELLNRVPAGSLGLMLQPYWVPTFKVVGPEAKGAIIGFGEAHTRAHIYRAILEGIGYALREGQENTEKKTGVPVTRLRVSGGGSRSRAAMQLTADLFGLPTGRVHTYETSALGAAIIAAVGLKLHPDFPAAVQAMSRPDEPFQPEPAAHQIYEQLYRRVYKKMYAQLQPFYAEIQKITGYPS